MLKGESVMLLEACNRKFEKHRVAVLGWGLCLLLVVSILMDYVLFYAACSLNPMFANMTERTEWVAAIAQYGFGVPACLFFFRQVRPDPMEKSRLSGRWLFGYFFICCALMIGGNLLGIRVNDAIGSLLGHTPSNQLQEISESTSLLYSFATTVVLAPVTEELVFRKGLCDRLNRLGDRTAILASAAFFALFHGNFYQCFYAFFVGLILAYVYLRTARIQYTIELHMMVNFFFGLLPEVLTEAPDLFYTLWIYLLLIFVAAGAVLFVIRFRKKRLLKGWIEPPEGGFAGIICGNSGFIALAVLCGVMFFLNVFLA